MIKIGIEVIHSILATEEEEDDSVAFCSKKAVTVDMACWCLGCCFSKHAAKIRLKKWEIKSYNHTIYSIYQI